MDWPQTYREQSFDVGWRRGTLEFENSLPPSSSTMMAFQVFWVKLSKPSPPQVSCNVVNLASSCADLSSWWREQREKYYQHWMEPIWWIAVYWWNLGISQLSHPCEVYEKLAKSPEPASFQATASASFNSPCLQDCGAGPTPWWLKSGEACPIQLSSCRGRAWSD